MNYGFIQEKNLNNNVEKNQENNSSNFSIDNFFFTQEENISNEHNLINMPQKNHEKSRKNRRKRVYKHIILWYIETNHTFERRVPMSR